MRAEAEHQRVDDTVLIPRHTAIVGPGHGGLSSTER